VSGDGDLVCVECGTAGSASAPVKAVIVFAPCLPGGCHVIMPAEPYPLCTARPRGAPCPSIGEFVERAVVSHPVTRDAGACETWTSAVIVVADEDTPPWRLQRRCRRRRRRQARERVSPW
jgi:hypothetical protein